MQLIESFENGSLGKTNLLSSIKPKISDSFKTSRSGYKCHHQSVLVSLIDVTMVYYIPFSFE